MTKDKTIPAFADYEEMAEFWDTHDLVDYWEQTEPAEFEVSPRHADVTSYHWIEIYWSEYGTWHEFEVYPLKAL